MPFTKNLTAALTIALTFNFAVSSDAAFSASGDENCLVLKQRDYKLGGFTVYLGEKRARVDCMNGKCTIIATAPTWDVVVYNKDKQYFPISRKDWHATGLKGMARSMKEFFDPKRYAITKVKFLGHDSIQTTRSVGFGRDSFDLAFRVNAKRAKQQGRRKVTYVGSSDFKFSNEVADFVEGFYLTPPRARVLLSTVSAIGDEKVATFVTYSIEKKRCRENLFKVPSGLKKVYSVSAVATGRDMEGVLLEVLGDDHP